MKRKLLQTVLVIIGICATSCSKDLGIENTITQETQTIEPKHLSLIESMGFNTDDIVEMEKNYVVEGDIIIYKTYIDSISLIPATRQARHEHITNGRERDIRVSTVALQSGGWEPAIRDALKAWNEIPNCPVYFRFVGNWAGDVFVRTNSYIDDDIPAKANIPHAGRPGFEVEINPDYNNRYDRKQKTFVMVHEFGHIIGLAHTDMITRNPAWHILGTPDWDAGQRDYNSVMLHEYYGQRWGDGPSEYKFTPSDIAAIQAMYGTPIWSSEIVGPDACVSGECGVYTLELGTNLITTDLNVKWYEHNILRQNSTSLSYLSDHMSSKTPLRAVVSYGGKSYEATKEISVFDVNIAGDGSPIRNYYFEYNAQTPDWRKFNEV